MTLPANMTTDVLTHRAEALRLEIRLAVAEGWSPRRIAELATERAEALDELRDRAIAELLGEHKASAAVPTSTHPDGGCTCCGAGVSQWR